MHVVLLCTGSPQPLLPSPQQPATSPLPLKQSLSSPQPSRPPFQTAAPFNQSLSSPEPSPLQPPEPGQQSSAHSLKQSQSSPGAISQHQSSAILSLPPLESPLMHSLSANVPPSKTPPTSNTSTAAHSVMYTFNLMFLCR